MKILGIDPGLRKTGYGLVNEEGCLLYGTFTSDDSCSLSERIKSTTDQLDKLINAEKPDICAVETLFFKPAAARSVIMSAHMRGAIFFLLQNKKLPILEITPAKVKLSVTGSGRASKQQMQYMIGKLFNIEERIDKDAADALAIAYCAAKWQGL